MADDVKQESENGVLEKDSIEQQIESLSTTEHCLRLEEHTVPIKGVDNKVINYTLKELGSEDRAEYMDFQNNKARFTEGKFAGMKNLKGLETRLVALSLYAPDGNRVPEVVIATWPGRLTKKLAAIAARISGLDDKAEVKAKNS